MALRYRGNVPDDHKVLVDSSDTAASFLSSKLVVAASIVETILNVGGNEQLQLSVNTGVGGIIDTITPTGVDVSGQTAGVKTKASASDHAHQLANPVTGTVNITPSTDVASIIITQPATLVSSPLVIGDALGNIIFTFVGTGAGLANPGTLQFGTVVGGVQAGGTFQTLTDPMSIMDAAQTVQVRVQAASPQVAIVNRLQVRSKNVLVLETVSEIQASATVPNADTAVKSYSLPANSYTRIIVEAEGYVSTTATSTQQDINIKLKAGATQMGATIVFSPETVASAGKSPFAIKANRIQTGAATIAVTIGAAAADINTSVFVNSLRVYGEV